MDVDDIDTDKFKTVPTDLRKLSNAVNNNAIKKTVYDELVKKVSTIDSGKQNLEKKIEDADKKISDTSLIN